MDTETALPTGEQPAASTLQPNTIEAEPAKVIPEGEANPEGEAKPAKTESELRMEQLERENKRLQRGIDRRTRQREEARAEANQYRSGLTPQPGAGNNPDQNDSEPLTLSRADLNKLVKAEAEKLAPTLAGQQAETQRRQGVIQSFEKTWGKEKFDEISSDLDDAFGGLADRTGSPKPATLAVFEADDPVKVIEYLAEPDNLDEAERISKLSPIAAGKAIAKLEAKLATSAPKPKDQVSNAAAPLEPIKGRGAVNTTGQPDPKNTRAWTAWRNEQERKGLA